MINGRSTGRRLMALFGRGQTARREVPRRLRDFSGSFSEHHVRTDVEFNELAKSLRTLFEISQALAGLVGERLGLVRQALNESRIAKPEGVAAAALQDLRNGLTETEAELSLLQSVSGQLWRMHSEVESIERVGRSIHLTVFGFAVESARTDQCMQTFGSFAVDLRTLGDRITSLAEAINGHAGAAHAMLEAEWKTLSVSHAQLCRLATELEATAGATATDAQAMLDRVLQGLQQSEARMQEITHQAGEALFHLQFGDIIRQKTEHIAEALREAADQLDPNAPGREFGAQAAAADRVIAIQIGQLELIRTEVETARRKLEESFQTLGNATERMCEILSQWGAAADQPGNQPDSLAAFKADLLRLENLHRLGQELRQGARRSIQKVTGVSEELAGHADEVRTLNADLHLQALNAIVKTAALGDEGATLSVLSMHVDLLYGESQQVVTGLVAMLEALLEQTRARIGDLAEAGESAQNLRQSGLENIETAINGCGATFVSANKLVAEQQAAIAGSRALLDFLAGQVPTIAGQIGELTRLREMLAPCISPADAAAVREVPSNVRYTMQSERDIHERALRSAGPAPRTETEAGERLEAPRTQDPVAVMEPAHPEPPAPVLTAPEIGDNVELF